MPEKLSAFDEKIEIVRKWIEMKERLPSDDIAEMLLQGSKKHVLKPSKILFTSLPVQS